MDVCVCVCVISGLQGLLLFASIPFGSSENHFHMLACASSSTHTHTHTHMLTSLSSAGVYVCVRAVILEKANHSRSTQQPTASAGVEEGPENFLLGLQGPDLSKEGEKVGTQLLQLS